MTYPTAFTVSLLAWGILQFPEGYASAKATLAAANTVRWGADYLLKTVAATENGTQIVYQVCADLQSKHRFSCGHFHQQLKCLSRWMRVLSEVGMSEATTTFQPHWQRC